MAFDAEEKAQFDKSDQREWNQWVKNNCTRIVPDSEERSIPRALIFSAPMRFVRINQGDERRLQAKSRIVIPGH